METRYFVDYKLHNAENDGWAYKTTKNTTDIAEAKKDYHSQLSQYIGSTAYDFVQVGCVLGCLESPTVISCIVKFVVYKISHFHNLILLFLLNTFNQQSKLCADCRCVYCVCYICS